MKGIPTKAKRSLKVGALAFPLLASLLTSPSWAEEGISSRARAIFEGHIQAVGGREAIKSVQAIRIKGRMSMPAAGMSMSLLVVQKAPNLFYTEQVIPGMGKNVVAYDGEQGWMQNPMMGFRIMPEAELAPQLEENDIHADLKFEEKYASARVVDEKSAGEVVVLEAVRKLNGETDTLHFDKTTRLLRRIETIADMGPQGKLPVAMVFGDYIGRGKLKTPASMTISNPAMEMVMTFDEVAYNADISDIRFSPPAQ